VLLLFILLSLSIRNALTPPSLLRSQIIIEFGSMASLLGPHLLNSLTQHSQNLLLTSCTTFCLFHQATVKILGCMPQSPFQFFQLVINVQVESGSFVRFGLRRAMGSAKRCAGTTLECRGVCKLIQLLCPSLLHPNSFCRAVNAFADCVHPSLHSVHSLLYLLQLANELTQRSPVLAQAVLLAATLRSGTVQLSLEIRQLGLLFQGIDSEAQGA